MITDDLFWAFVAIVMAMGLVALVMGFNLVVADALVRSIGRFGELLPNAGFGR